VSFSRAGNICDTNGGLRRSAAALFQANKQTDIMLPLSVACYRAMLCTARTMLLQDVCPYVTRQYCVKTAEHSLILF